MSDNQEIAESDYAVKGEFIGQISFYRLPDGRVAALSAGSLVDGLEAVRVVTLLTEYAAAMSRRTIESMENDRERADKLEKLRAAIIESEEGE